MTPDPVAVPDGWHRVRLGDLGRFVNGRAFKPSDWGQSGLPIVRIQNLTSAEAPFNHYDGEVGDDNLIDTGDIVVSWSASIEARTWDRGPAVLNQHIFKVVERSGVADKRFLFFLLEAATSELRRRVHGTTMQHVTKGTFDSTPALLPPLAEQRAIAAVLDAIDEAIERTEEVIATTERLRDALLHELLTRGLPGRHSEWADVPGLGTVPACWDVVRLGDVCQRPEYGANTPAVPFDPALPRYVRITDITDDGRLRPDDPRSAEPSATRGYKLDPGDLLFARSGATVGKTYLHRRQDGPCSYAGYLIRFRALPDVASPEFLERWTRSQFYGKWVASMLRAGAQPNINATEYSSLPIPLPPLAEQQAIAAALDGVDGTIERAREERARLHSLQASAADALLTGRVRVAAISRSLELRQ